MPGMRPLPLQQQRWYLPHSLRGLSRGQINRFHRGPRLEDSLSAITSLVAGLVKLKVLPLRDGWNWMTQIVSNQGFHSFTVSSTRLLQPTFPFINSRVSMGCSVRAGAIAV